MTKINWQDKEQKKEYNRNQNKTWRRTAKKPAKELFKELAEIKKLYEWNFQRLIKYTGTPRHKRYATIEKALTKREMTIRRIILPHTIGNPCPAGSTKYCYECSGYIKPKPKNRKMSRNFSYVIVKKGTSGATLCNLSDEALKKKTCNMY